MRTRRGGPEHRPCPHVPRWGEAWFIGGVSYLLPRVDAVADPRASGLGAALAQRTVVHLGHGEERHVKIRRRRNISHVRQGSRTAAFHGRAAVWSRLVYEDDEPRWPCLGLPTTRSNFCPPLWQNLNTFLMIDFKDMLKYKLAQVIWTYWVTWHASFLKLIKNKSFILKNNNIQKEPS